MLKLEGTKHYVSSTSLLLIRVCLIICILWGSFVIYDLLVAGETPNYERYQAWGMNYIAYLFKYIAIVSTLMYFLFWGVRKKKNSDVTNGNG